MLRVYGIGLSELKGFYVSDNPMTLNGGYSNSRGSCMRVCVTMYMAYDEDCAQRTCKRPSPVSRVDIIPILLMALAVIGNALLPIVT